MKICLVALNAKYIHTNPAVASLRAFAGAAGFSCDIIDCNINQTDDRILKEIFRAGPDVLAFSVYLWNCETVFRIAEKVSVILPETEIWYGGPEVSFRAEAVLNEQPFVTGIMRGEGEETFAELCACWNGTGEMGSVAGITRRTADGHVSNPDRAPMDMDKLVFPYTDIDPDPDRIVYYESSRGCPFRCAYCLSSEDRTVRFKKTGTVERELQWFLDRKVPLVKFTDRTFNCRKEHALAVWNYIRNHDNGITCFHFELGADLLDKEQLEVLTSLRPGQVQLEIGVQSLNPETLKAVRRETDFSVLSKNVTALKAAGNIHIHLDLIAGLPFEEMESFRHSFNGVYRMRPEQLQLGFLKVLGGTRMEQTARTGCIRYENCPPYEVLSTDWLSYGDILELKSVEEMTEVYYNSGQFERTLTELEKTFPDPYAMLRALADFYREHGYDAVSHSRLRRYEIVLEFVQESGRDRERFLPCLILDAYGRENVKTRPEWMGDSGITSRESRSFYAAEAASPLYLPGYEDYSPQQMHSMTHLERVGEQVFLFDYRKRDPLTNNALVRSVPAEAFRRVPQGSVPKI